MHVNCAHCQQPVTLQFADWSPEHADLQDQPQPWVCPACRQKNEGRFPGLLKYVWKGHRESR